MFTLDGVPLLYNGMEVGDTTESGAPALFERLPVFWPIAERRPEFVRLYPALAALRREHPALRGSELLWLANSDDSRVLTYLRPGEGEELLVAVNLSNRPFEGAVILDRAEGFSDITPAAEPRPVLLPALELEAWGYRVVSRASRGRPQPVR
jgi:glycosidase